MLSKNLNCRHNGWRKMQIEVENLYGDAWIFGPECSEEELIVKLTSVYISVNPREFVNEFCNKYSFKVIPLKECYPSPEWIRVCGETDYRFDLDVGLIFKVQKSMNRCITIYNVNEHYSDFFHEHKQFISVPKTLQAMFDEYFGKWNPEDSYLWELTYDQYHLMINEGVFVSMNNLLSCQVGAYENDSIYYQTLFFHKEKLFSMLRQFDCKYEIDRLIEMIEQAIESRTLISFML